MDHNFLEGKVAVLEQRSLPLRFMWLPPEVAVPSTGRCFNAVLMVHKGRPDQHLDSICLPMVITPFDLVSPQEQIIQKTVGKCLRFPHRETKKGKAQPKQTKEEYLNFYSLTPKFFSHM